MRLFSIHFSKGNDDNNKQSFQKEGIEVYLSEFPLYCYCKSSPHKSRCHAIQNERTECNDQCPVHWHSKLKPAAAAYQHHLPVCELTKQSLWHYAIHVISSMHPVFRSC